jgi:uncharacterized protein YjbJ (UPF0337 family)
MVHDPFEDDIAFDTPGRLVSLESVGMNSSTTDKTKGTAKQATGKAKEVAGKVIGDPNLQDRGTAEKADGIIQEKVGEVKKVFGK